MASALKSEKTIIASIAICDSIPPLGYLLTGDPLLLQTAALFLKIVIVFLNFDKIYVKSHYIFLLGAMITLTASGAAVDFFGDKFSYIEFSKYLSFTISLMITISLTNSKNIQRYCNFSCIIPTCVAFAHVFLAFSGRVASSYYGRYEYVNGAHPNLGGEIAAAGAFACAIAIRGKISIPILAILFTSAYICESRAALISIIICTLICLYSNIITSKAKFSLSIGIIVSIIVSILLVLYTKNIINFISHDLLMSDDAYRGGGTGFVGRDERWALGMKLFRESPFVGNGLSITTDSEFTVHNALLYSLAKHGLLSIIFWLPFIIALHKIFKENIIIFASILSMIPLFVFNDRFINLNNYPFIVYVVIFTFFVGRDFTKLPDAAIFGKQRSNASQGGAGAEALARPREDSLPPAVARRRAALGAGLGKQHD